MKVGAVDKRLRSLSPCRGRLKDFDSKKRLFIQALLREILSSFGCYVSQILRTSFSNIVVLLANS
ncbi:hypothetical protein BFR57_12335 [Idiomarina sp. MD25a]|nr:hypothetical protein BFR57_12335 [Idiomarina sp. MD25a]